MEIILKKIEEIKKSLNNDFNNFQNWEVLSKLLSLYRHFIVANVDYTLEKRIDQELWNQVFKKIIAGFQYSLKEKKKNEESYQILSNLSLFLDTAFGFYTMMLQELCLIYNIEYPFFKASHSFGILDDYDKKIFEKEKNMEGKNEILNKAHIYLCQYCLIHLGDISRYKGHLDQASSFYITSYRLLSNNGHPFNQLAIIESLKKGHNLESVYYYVRSLHVQHPFQLAKFNLKKLFVHLVEEYPALEVCMNNINMNELNSRASNVKCVTNAFLTITASINLDQQGGLDDPALSKCMDYLKSQMPYHIYYGYISPCSLIRMFVITLFKYHTLANDTITEMSANNGVDEQNLTIKTLVLIFESTLSSITMIKDEKNIPQAPFLPYLNLFLKWFIQQKCKWESCEWGMENFITDNAWNYLTTIACALKKVNFGSNKSSLPSPRWTALWSDTITPLDNLLLPEEKELAGYLPLDLGTVIEEVTNFNKPLANDLDNHLRRVRILKSIHQMAVRCGKSKLVMSLELAVSDIETDASEDKAVDLSDDKNAAMDPKPEEERDGEPNCEGWSIKSSGEAHRKSLKEQMAAKADLFAAHKLLPTADGDYLTEKDTVRSIPYERNVVERPRVAGPLNSMRIDVGNRGPTSKVVKNQGGTVSRNNGVKAFYKDHQPLAYAKPKAVSPSLHQVGPTETPPSYNATTNEVGSRGTDWNSFDFDFYEAFLNNQGTKANPSNQKGRHFTTATKEFFNFDNAPGMNGNDKHGAILGINPSPGTNSDSYSLFNSKWNLDFNFSLDAASNATVPTNNKGLSVRNTYGDGTTPPYSNGHFVGGSSNNGGGAEGYTTNPWKPKPFELNEIFSHQGLINGHLDERGPFNGTWAPAAIGNNTNNILGNKSFTSV